MTEFHFPWGILNIVEMSAAQQSEKKGAIPQNTDTPQNTLFHVTLKKVLYTFGVAWVTDDRLFSFD